MKAIFKLVAVFIVLLALLSVTVACDNGSDVPDVDESPTVEEDTDNKTESEEMTDVPVEYLSSVSKWTEYLFYHSDKYEVSYDKLFVGQEGAQEIYLNGDIYCVNKITQSQDRVDTVIEVKNFDGKLLASFTSVDHGDSYEKNIIYTVNTGFARGIFEVEKLIYVAEGDGETVEYTPTYTYSYYTCDGEVLAEELSNQGSVREPDNTSAAMSQRVVYIGDKTYIISLEDGSVIASFDKGMEHLFPQFDAGSSTPDISNPDAYAFFEQGEYKYMIVEEYPTTVQIGDFAMYTVPGIEIIIFNSDYSVCAQYVSNSYAITGYAILSNGDVYVCEYVLLSKNATEYDLKLQGEKFNIIHTVIDAQSGKTTVIEKDYVISKTVNNTTGRVRSFLSRIALGSQSDKIPFDVKEGYILAEIQGFEGGALDPQQKYVILDEQLNIVSELGCIFPNQLGYIEYISEDIILIPTKAVNNCAVYYSASIKTGKTDLYLSDKQGVSHIDGGYLYGNVIYNREWEEVYNLSESFDGGALAFDRVIDGDAYCRNDKGEIVVLTMDEDSRIAAKILRSFEYDYGTCSIIGDKLVKYVSQDNLVTEYLTLDGNVIASHCDTAVEYVENEMYNITYQSDVSELSGGAYALRITENWVMENSDAYVGELDTHITYTTYYIIK